MTKTKVKGDSIAHKLAAALRAHERAKTDSRPEDNPFHDRGLDDMALVGLDSQDKVPAVNMAPKGGLGYDMEVARNKVQTEAKADKSAKRMAQARARAARKVEFDKIAESPVQPSAERMQQAWTIVAHLLPTITKIANSKRKWAARHLGDVTDDVAAATMENMALMLAKSDQDLDVLEVCAREIGEATARTNQVPGEQMSEEEAKERKAIRRGRKWLMQVVNNRVMDTLIDVYFRSHNLRCDNIDRIATVMAAINGPGEDPLTSNFKASRAPAFLGTKFQRPGGIDPALLAAAISGAITERKLDPMVELLLGNIRTDGAFPWTEMAEQVFLASPTGDGEWMWQAVCQATTGRNRNGREWTIDRASKARADAAMTYVRRVFEWLPGFIIETIEAFDPHLIGFSAKAEGGARAILASDFELYYLPDAPTTREPLRPTLRYASTQEAADALIEQMSSLLTTGEDLVQSLVSA